MLELLPNPIPIADLASYPLDEFMRSVVVTKRYRTMSGRTFARVQSKHGDEFVTDVPINPGNGEGRSGGSKLSSVNAIKKRAWEQLRIGLSINTKKNPKKNPRKKKRNPAPGVEGYEYRGHVIEVSGKGIRRKATIKVYGAEFHGTQALRTAEQWIDRHIERERGHK